MASKSNKGEILAKFFDDGEYTALFADGAVSAFNLVRPRKSVTYVSLSKSENVIFSFPSRISLSRFPHKNRKANRSISL